VTDRFVRDRIEILDVVTRYFTSVDHRDFERLRTCFTDDAVGSFEGNEVGPGVDALMDFFEGRSVVEFPVEIVDLQLSHHLLSNHTVAIEGDRAWAETFATAHLVDRPPGGPRLRTRGLRYEDELARTAAGWRISRRVHVCDWMRLDTLLWAADRVGEQPPPLR
jgi:hypothetical protein